MDNDAAAYREVVQVARAFWEDKYGPLGDWLSIEDVRHDASGYHVRGYIKTFGFVHCLVDDETVDLLRPFDDYLADEH